MNSLGAGYGVMGRWTSAQSSLLPWSGSGLALDGLEAPWRYEAVGERAGKDAGLGSEHGGNVDEGQGRWRWA